MILCKSISVSDRPSDAMNKKTRILTISKWILGVIAALLLLLGALFGLAQTEMGKRQLAAWLAAGLSGGVDIEVKLGRIDGFVPFDVRLDFLTAGDGTEEWLRVENIVLRWCPAQLLRRRLHVNELSATTMRLERLPPPQHVDKARKKELPTWPPSFPPLIVERFLIEKLALGASVIGQNAAFRIEGQMDTGASMADRIGLLQIERMDGPKANATVSWTLIGKSGMLVLHAKVEEAEDGLLSAALGIKGAGPLAIELHGEAPLKAWQGQLIAKAEKIGAIEAAIKCIAQEDLRLTAEGTIRPVVSALPPVLTPVVIDGAVSFGFDVSYRSRRELVVQQAHLETDGASLHLMGRLDLKKQHIRGDFTLDITELSPLETLIGTHLKGRLSFRGNLSGSLRQPQAMLFVMAHNAQVGGLRASRIEAEFVLKSLHPLHSAFPGLVIEGKGRVEGLKHPKEYQLFEAPFQWLLSAQIRTQREISIRKLNLETENILLTFSGQVDPVALFLKGEAAVEVRDLRMLSGLWATQLQGATRFHAHLEADGRSGSLLASIEGQLNGLAPLPPLLGALVWSEIWYEGHMEWANGRLVVTDLKLHSTAAKLTGSVAVNFLDNEVKGQGHLDISRLAVLSQPIGQALHGSLEMDVEIGGPFQSLKILAKATGSDVSIGRVRVHHVVTALHAEGVPARPQGRLQLELQLREQTLRAMTIFTLNGPQLMLSKLSMLGPGTQCTGNLTLDLHTLMAEGVLWGRSEDLSPLFSFLGEEIRGSAEFKVELMPRKVGQDITFVLNGRQLVTRFGQVGEMSLRASLMNVFKDMNGEAKIEVKAFHEKDLRFDTLVLSAAGNGKKMAFSSQASGQFKENFKLELQGILDATQKKEQQLELHLLQGRYKEYPLTLTQPTVIKHSSDGYAIEGFVLQVGPGHLQATGSLGAQAIAMIVNWEHLPLEVLGLIGIPDFTGKATGRLDITGQLDQPEGSLQVHLMDVRLRNDAFKTLPPATLTSKAELQQGQLQATLSIEGLARKPLEASAEFPLNLSLSPLALSVPLRGEVRGRLAAEVNLVHIAPLLYLEDQSLEGYLTIDLSLSGRAEAPEITGHARIVKAAYENTRTGTIFKDIHVQMRAKDRKIFIEEARATDSGTGAISAQGWFEFIPGKDFPFQFDVHLKKADLVRQDDLTGTVSGHVSLSGSLVDPAVTGKVDIGPADIQIPDRLPPEITELEVVEINRPGQETEPQETLRMRKARRLRLDLQLNFPGRLFIRGRGLDSEWKGALEIKGNMKEPLVMGTLTVVRGHLNLFGKRFVLSKGNLAFNGNMPPSPNFDAIAEHKRSDITARVQLTGTPSAIVVTLESDPPLPEDEILARVLFGRSVTNITPVQALQLAQAVNTLAGGGGGILDVMDRTRELLGVEQLEVKQMEEGDGKASVSIGKYLMEGVYVEVDKVVGTGLDPEGDKVSVEVEITPNISVETETGIDGQGGVGLNWKWDY